MSAIATGWSSYCRICSARCSCAAGWARSRGPGSASRRSTRWRLAWWSATGPGGILFANAAAEAHARSGDGLVLGGAGLGVAAFYPGESALLRALIADAANGGTGGAVAITGYEGGRLFMLVAPLPARIADEPGRVLVTMRPAAAGPTFDAFTLQRLFGLTQAEARLALALLAGRSLAEYGAERQVTENTLRTQLAHVLRKTETGSQRELVRLLGLLPPLR